MGIHGQGTTFGTEGKQLRGAEANFAKIAAEKKAKVAKKMPKRKGMSKDAMKSLENGSLGNFMKSHYNKD